MGTAIEELEDNKSLKSHHHEKSQQEDQIKLEADNENVIPG
jgi:hypothetical protein